MIMQQVVYTVRRHVPVARTPDGPKDTAIALVVFQMPGDPAGQFRHLAVHEELIKFESGGTPEGETAVIEAELANVVSQITAGANLAIKIKEPS